MDFTRLEKNTKHALNLALEKMNEINYDVTSQANIIKICNEALEISPLCADAYAVLADYEDNLFEKKNLCEKAILTVPYQISKKSSITECDIYHIAMNSLAITLWHINTPENRKKAIKYAKYLLKTYSRDGFGLRYFVFNWFIEEGKYESAKTLKDSYGADFTALGRYGDVLINYALGNMKKAKELLELAFQSNRYVPYYIMGLKEIPDKYEPMGYTLGFEDEAVYYSMISINAWEKVEGAINWLTLLYNNPKHDLVTINTSNTQHTKSGKLFIKKQDSMLQLYLDLPISKFKKIQVDLRGLCFLAYVENNNIMFAIRYGKEIRYETLVMQYPLNEEDKGNGYIDKIVSEEGIPLFIYSSKQNNRAIRYMIPVKNRPLCVLTNLQHGCEYMFEIDGVKYFTDLRDKFGMDYRYTTEMEAKTEFIRNITQNETDKDWNYIKSYLSEKFDIKQLWRYNIAKEAVPYLEKKYPLIVDFDSIKVCSI